MKCFTKKVRIKAQRILSVLMALLMVVSILPATLWAVSDKAEAETIGAATAVDINFNWREFELMLNPAYSIREIDDYLKELDNISNTPGVNVHAKLGVEYMDYCAYDPFDKNHGYYTASFRSDRVQNCTLTRYFDMPFSEDTIKYIQKRVKELNDGDYEARNMIYRVIFEVDVRETGALEFKKSTPLTINGENFSVDHTDARTSTRGHYYIDLDVHEATMTRVGDLRVSLELITQKGYQSPTGSIEKEDIVKKDPLNTKSDEFDVAYNIRKGVEYNVTALVSQYGGVGSVYFTTNGLNKGNGLASDVKMTSFDGVSTSLISVYVDPEDTTDQFDLVIKSYDDPSVFRTIRFNVKESSSYSIYLLEDQDPDYCPHAVNYVDFNGKKTQVIADCNYNSLFRITGEMNDKVVNVEITGNTKPITWFEIEKQNNGIDFNHLFTIDANETSKHLVLTASLRAHPECKVTCHYYLSSKWVTIQYKMDSRTNDYIEYKYPVGETFNLASGADAVEEYKRLYPKNAGNLDATKYISGWIINEKFYGVGKPLTTDGNTSTLVAKAVWADNPIVEQPVGVVLDTTSTATSVPASLPVKMDATNLGDLSNLTFYLEKYNVNNRTWEATTAEPLRHVTNENFLKSYTNVVYRSRSLDSEGCFIFKAGVAPVAASYGTYRYKVVTEDLTTFITNSFVVGARTVEVYPVNQELDCGGSVSVSYVVNDSSVKNARYQWWYLAYDKEESSYIWTRIDNLSDNYNVEGYNTSTLTIHAEDLGEDFTLMEGMVKCRFIDADTSQVICESDEVTISLVNHSMTEAINPENSSAHHMIRCAKCHGISPTMYPYHAFRWVYSDIDPTEITWKCKDCGYIDPESENIEIPPKRNNMDAQITFHSNDGNNKTKTVYGKQYQTLDTKPYEFVSAANSGYTQIGWAFNAESKVPDYSMDDLAIMDNTYDLYAVWKETENRFVLDLLNPNKYEFWYGGTVEFNEYSSLLDDEEFLDDYLNDIVELQWIRRSKDGTVTVIGTNKTPIKDCSFTFPVDDPDGLYVGSYIQLRVIDGNRVFCSSEVAFDSSKVETIEPEPLNINGASLTMEGQIGVNFFLTIPDVDMNLQGAYIYMSYTGSTTEPIKVLLKDGIYTTDKGYKFTFPVAVKELCDKVSLQAYTADGEVIPLTRGSKKKPVDDNVFKYAVIDYLNDVPVYNSGDTKLVAFAQSLVNYGAEAQNYFKHNAGTLTSTADYSKVTSATLQPYDATKSGPAIDGLKVRGVSLTLESELIMNVAFASTDDVISKVTFKVNGKEVKPVKQPDGMYKIEVPNIAAKDLDEFYTVEYTDGTNTQVVKCCPLGYAYTVLQGSDEGLKTLVKAMYLYNQAANEYFHES